MVEKETPALSLRRQCELLHVSRSGLAYTPVSPDAEELALMRHIDELHLKYPFYGIRMLRFTLRVRGLHANRKRIQRLMRVMGIESMAPKPSTSVPHPEHAKDLRLESDEERHRRIHLKLNPHGHEH